MPPDANHSKKQAPGPPGRYHGQVTPPADPDPRSAAAREAPSEGASGPPEDLPRLLREAEGETLLELVRKHAEHLDVPAARQVLRNPFAGREVVEALLEARRLLTSHQLRAALAHHPHTPQTHALRFVSGLYWRELLSLGTDTRVPPAVRRAADRALVSRLQGLAAGEKMAIARRGGPGVLAELRRDPDPRVIGALLSNPRLTEGTLMPLVNDDKARPEVLRTIAEDRRWGVRYPLRVALAKNGQTPVRTALGILPHLKKRDLRAVSRARRVSAPVRQRAKVLLGEG